jgi:hypothetical protein
METNSACHCDRDSSGVSDPLFKDRGILSHYGYYLHYHFHCSEEEMQEFARLWELILLQS